MPVGCCDHHRQRGAASVYHKMAFCARFATIRADASGVRIRPGMRPFLRLGCSGHPQPLDSSPTGRHPRDDPAALRGAASRRRPHSSRADGASRSCHCGSRAPGAAAFEYERMPVRAARSGIRGIPPRDLGGSGGKSDSMTAQSSSDTRGFAMLRDPRLLN